MIRTTIAGFREVLLRISTFWWTMVARFRLWVNGASVGRNFVVTGPLHLRVHRTAQVSIGDNCRFHSGFEHNPVGGYRRMGIWAGQRATLSIGSNVGISNSTIVCTCEVIIGDDARIGGDCRIYDTDFHSIRAAQRLQRPQAGVARKPIRLGRRCFVGGHCTILKGVDVGDEAVIGASSVVTKSVPSAEIWAGNPCRFLRKTGDA